MKRRRGRAGVRAPRVGTALLEALVSLAIIGMVGLAALQSLLQAQGSLRVAQGADHDFERAVALLDAAMLWSRKDLDQRLGDRRQGPWVMRIDRVRAGVYDIALWDSSKQRLLLQSATARPVRVAP